MVQDNPKRPNIRLKVAWLTLNNLWSHKCNSSSHLLYAFVLVKFRCHAEVTNLDSWWRISILDENVQMFHIAMHDTSLMHITQALSNLQYDCTGEILCELVSSEWLHEREQVSALHILSGQISLISMIKLVDKSYHVTAVLAEAHGIGLAYLLLASEALVLGGIYGF